MISGPSGAGKGTLIDAVVPRFAGALVVAVSATTRAPRPGEQDGVDYHFLSEKEFTRRVAAGEFLEHVVYAGNHYGTLRTEVERQLDAGRSVVVEIELRGARAIRSMLPDAITVFIAPPSVEALVERLRRRGSDSPEAIALRMRESTAEMAAQGEFDRVVVNDDVEGAGATLERLIREDLAMASRGGSDG